MKRFALLILLIAAPSLFSTEQLFDYSGHIRLGYTPGTRDILMSLRVGAGFDYAVAFSKAFAPGVQIDFGVFPLVGMLKESAFLFNAEARVFNLFRFGKNELRPFLGYDFAYGSHESNQQGNHLFVVGLEFVFRFIGLEYSYLMGTEPMTFYDFGDAGDILVPGTGSYHRIGVVFRLRPR